jgi:hypothetical protein
LANLRIQRHFLELVWEVIDERHSFVEGAAINAIDSVLVENDVAVEDSVWK